MNYEKDEIQRAEDFLKNLSDVYWIFIENTLTKKGNGFDQFFNSTHDLIPKSESDSFRNLVVPEEQEALNDWDKKSAEGKQFRTDLKLKSSPHEEKWCRVDSFLVPGIATNLRVGFVKDISFERQRERELSEIIDRYEGFISHTSEGIYRIELSEPVDISLSAEEQVKEIYKHSYVAECNLAFAKMYGTSSIYEVIGKKLSDLHADNPLNYKETKEFIESNYLIQNKLTIEKDKDGNEVFFNNNAIGIVENGKLLRTWGTQSDLTKQIVAEEKARVLSRAIEQSQVSIIITDLNGDIEYVNPKFLNITGYKLEEVIGKKPSILKSGTEPPELYADLWSKITDGKEWSGIICNRKKNGELFWESAIISPVKNSLGELIHYIAVKEDITEKVKADEELENHRTHLEEMVNKRTKEIKEQYQFLTTLIETLPNPVYVLNEKDEYQIVNKSFEEFTQLKKDDILGKTLNNAGPKFESLKNINPGNIIPSRHDTDVFEGEIRTKSTVKNAIIYETKLSASESLTRGTLGILIDITDRKRLETQIRQALEKEKELNQLKTDFISMVSHEFRTPLTAILTASEFIERYYDRIDKTKLLKQIEKINLSVDKMTALLEDVIFLSRKERGKLQFAPQKLHLNETLKRLIDDVSVLLTQDQSITFNYNLENEEFKLDKKLIYIIFTNLLTNAVKYSPNEKEIEFSVESAGTEIKFTVQDHGIGIKASDREKIFEPFFRTSEAGTIPGSGLGLSIVKEAIETHKGRISVDSEPAIGSKFEVFLPIG